MNKSIALQQFRRLPKTKITHQEITQGAWNPDTMSYNETIVNKSEWVYIGDITDKDVALANVLSQINNNLVNTARKMISLTEYAQDDEFLVGSQKFRIVAKMQKADIWIYGIERK